MEKKVEMSFFLNFYGDLLSPRQRECMELYCNCDYSFGEIAECLGVSRQAVCDNVQKAQRLFKRFESNLHLVSQFSKINSYLKNVLNKFELLQVLDEVKKKEILDDLNRIIDFWEDNDGV